MKVEDIHSSLDGGKNASVIRSLKINVDGAQFFSIGSSACRGILN
jgi:hypothetical protein